MEPSNKYCLKPKAGRKPCSFDRYRFGELCSFCMFELCRAVLTGRGLPAPFMDEFDRNRIPVYFMYALNNARDNKPIPRQEVLFALELCGVWARDYYMVSRYKDQQLYDDIWSSCHLLKYRIFREYGTQYERNLIRKFEKESPAKERDTDLRWVLKSPGFFDLMMRDLVVTFGLSSDDLVALRESNLV